MGLLHVLRPESDRVISMAVDAAQDARWDSAETWGPRLCIGFRSRGVEHACADVLLRLGHGRVEASNVFEAALRVQTVVGRLSAEDMMDSGLCRALVLAISGAVRDAIGEPVEKGVSTRVTCPVLALPLFQIVAIIMKKWPQSCDSSDYVGVLRDDPVKGPGREADVASRQDGQRLGGSLLRRPVARRPGRRHRRSRRGNARAQGPAFGRNFDTRAALGSLQPGGLEESPVAAPPARCLQPGDGEIVFLASVPLLVDLLNLGPESDSECEEAEEAGE